MRCYNNDILGHKASVFSWLRTAASPMATLHAVLWLSNSPCRCIQIAYCIAGILQFCLCPTAPPAPPHPSPMFVSERIFAYLPPYADGFCQRTYGKREAHAKTVDGRLSSPICCQRLLWIRFPPSLTVCHYQHGFGRGATFREFGKWRHLWTAGEAAAFPHKANVRLLKLALMVLQETHLLLLSNSQLFPSSQLSCFLTRHII